MGRIQTEKFKDQFKFEDPSESKALSPMPRIEERKEIKKVEF